MLSRVKQLPTDKKVAGVHCVPLTDQGNIVMAWDKEEQFLTTIGGRIEGNESINEALDREAMEEAGLVLGTERIPFAAWYWTNTDTYTVFFLAKAERFMQMPPNFEKTGYVIFNFETAKQMITKLEGDHGERTQILSYAEELAKQKAWI